MKQQLQLEVLTPRTEMEWAAIGLHPDKAERSKLVRALIQLGASPLDIARRKLNERIELVLELQAMRPR